jgi:hypothetical protein
MRNLVCWCPETQQPVDLQLYTDYATLARIWSNSVRFQCPHCGAEHETKVGAAALKPPSLEPHQAKLMRQITPARLGKKSGDQGKTNVGGDARHV